MRCGSEMWQPVCMYAQPLVDVPCFLQMKTEEGIVKRLVEPYGVEFHETACDGLRACEAACDVADFQISDAGDGEECRKKCALPPRISSVQRTLCCASSCDLALLANAWIAEQGCKVAKRQQAS